MPNCRWNPHFVKTFRLQDWSRLLGEVEPRQSRSRLPTGQCWTYAPLCSIDKKVHSCATSKYCFRSQFFMQYCLSICNRGNPMERNFLNFIFYPLGLGHSNIGTYQNFKKDVLIFYFYCTIQRERYDDVLLIAIYRTFRERRRKCNIWHHDEILSLKHVGTFIQKVDFKFDFII